MRKGVEFISKKDAIDTTTFYLTTAHLGVHQMHEYIKMIPFDIKKEVSLQELLLYRIESTCEMNRLFDYIFDECIRYYSLRKVNRMYANISWKLCYKN